MSRGPRRPTAWADRTVLLVSLVSVPLLLRRMEDDVTRRGALAPVTTCWMYATYAAHAALYARAVGAGGRSDPRRRTVGYGTAAAGTALCLAGMSRFNGPGQVSGLRDGALATGGAYRVTRNPQYVGYVLLLTGGAVARGSRRGVGLAALAAAVLRSWVPVEERHLRKTFGTAYERYAAVTPRWLGPPATDPALGRRRRVVDDRLLP
jgi:protein-S-isoprenylcysteine O-methyltransferase Ste14